MLRHSAPILISSSLCMAWLAGCSLIHGGASEEELPLDISIVDPGQASGPAEAVESQANPAPRHAAAEREDTAESSADPSSALSANAILNWREFFKPPPTREERSLLERTLAALSDEDDAAVLLQRARQETALGYFQRAEQSYRSLLRHHSGHEEGQLELAMLLLRRKDEAAAFQLLTELRRELAQVEKLHPQFILRYRYTLALLYLQKGEHRKGHTILSELVALDKGFTPGYAALASSYLALGKLGVAEFIVQRGLDRGSEDPALFNLKGVIAERSGQFETAEIWYDKALERWPQFAPALLNKGVLALKREDAKAARQLIMQSLVAQPQSIDAHVALGVLEKGEGHPTEAKGLFEKALELGPQNALARYNLAILLLQASGESGEALRLFHEVTQLEGVDKELAESARSYADDIQGHRKAF